ncbi:fibronectin type III domain-containing protein [Cohnella silvisoli]|uniref:Fibronectin type-III domain-containing protein n=1 Tax=Cohnella silvisoli TaxID=2873699 RepID=A0ABV1KXF4_9BACL|nr:exo-alpha-sialidase [Cohnella silvisoli]MCD9024088.1 hypothetical protein [Cohnella silvisoli]
MPSQKAEAAIDPTLQPAVVASGTSHTLFVLSDGTVKVSGSDASTGAMGLGNTTASYSTPTAVLGLTNVKQVAANGYNSYAVLKDGTVKAWGQNANGQLGLGNTSVTYTPTLISGLTNVKQLAVGNGFAIALLQDGTLKGWGTNTYGELTTLAATNSPAVIPGLSSVRQVAAGDKFVVALLTDGTVKTWGYNNYGQLGTGNTANQSSPYTISALSNAIQVAAGGSHTMVLLANGSVSSWGYNSNGQLGNGNTTNNVTPSTISTLSNVRYVSAGGDSSYVILMDDSIKTWGYNVYGQLGLGSTSAMSTPTSVSASVIPAYIYGSGTGNNAFMIGLDGKIYGTGYNTSGQLGIGNGTNQSVFTVVSGLTTTVSMLDMNVSITSGLSIISGSTSNSSFLLINGTVKAWGRNNNGQLGLGNTTDQTTPTAIPGLSGVKQLTVGQSHTLALMEDGTVKAWGYNSSGQLGLGNTTTQTTPTAITGLNGVKQLVAGQYHTLALMEDGTVKAWGRNDYGQLGIGNTTNQTTPAAITGLIGVKQLTAGPYHTFALIDNGTVMAWGYNANGELGLGNTTTQTTPKVITGLIGVKQLTAGYNHALALMEDGTVKVWGHNGSGQLGLGSTTNQTIPTTITGFSGVKQLAAGESHTLALMEDGSVKAWGVNGNGQLGLGNTTNQTTPTAIPWLSGVKQLVAGQYHTLALMDEGIVKSWGRNDFGQLGIGNITNKTSPTSITGLISVKQLVAGYNYTLALMEDGTVKAWGRNDYGQLGLGNTVNQTTPTAISGLIGVKQLTAGYYHTLALMEDGTVKVWGYNANSELGLGNTINQTAPTAIMGLVSVKQLVAGYSHTLALLEDGTVKVWGNNYYGQLGLGNTTAKTTPNVIPELSGVKQLAAGYSHTLALMEDGSVKAWGRSNNGQLGLGPLTTQTTPTVITGLIGIKQLAAGDYHSLALMEDGSVIAWGYNNNGQLGLGNTTNQTTPTAIPGLSGVKRLVAGQNHSLALMEDGMVKVWGLNNYGQLGLGNTTYVQATPTLNTGLSGVKKLAAGSSHTLALMDDGTVKAWGYNEYGQLGVPGNRYVPTTVDYFSINSFKVSVVFTSSFDSLSFVSLYLDNETEPRERTTTVLSGGSASLSFQSIAYATLPRGTHTARVVAQIGEQIYEKTTAFTVTEGSLSYPLDVVSSASSITVRGNTAETTTDLATAPYQITIGSQSSGWFSPGSTAVSSPLLDFAGTGNKRIVKLSNGWWAVAGYTGTASSGIRFMVSKDQGNTWSQLATLVDSANITSPPAIAASGNNIVGIVRYGTSGVRSFVINAITQTNDNMIAQTTTIDSGQTVVPASSGVAIAVDTSGNVHAVWVSKNASFSNSYNLRYIKSTDGGLTWAAVQQVTTQNLVGNNYANPSILLVNGTTPVLFSEYVSGTTYAISQQLWNGSNWTASTPVSVATYPQQSHQVYADGSNLYMVWSAASSTQPTINNIWFIKSTNGGSTWTSPVSLISGNTASQELPVVTSDNLNKLHVVFSGIDPAVSATAYNLRLMTSANSGGTWSAPKTLTFLTSGNATSPIVMQDVKLSYGTDNPLVIYNNTSTGQTEIRGTANTGAIFTASALTPDTKYLVKFEVKDSGGIIRIVTKDAYTLAINPAMTIQQLTGQAPILTVTDTNPGTTKYQITSGNKYLSSEGLLVAQPVSFALPGKILTLSKLDRLKTYNFKIRAINQEGIATNWSSLVRVGPPIVPPAVPKNIKSQPTSSAITLSWSPVSEATGYEIEIDNSSTLISNGRSLSYKHESLTPNTLHQYRVRAVKSGTAGSWSAPLIQRTLLIAPVYPTNIMPAATAKTVTLTWNTVQGAVAYEVEWDGQRFTAGQQSTFKQVDLPMASRHTYRVRALNAGGASPWSPTQIISTTNTLPSVPVVAAQIVSDKSVSLRWDTVLDALTYEVEADGAIVSLIDATTASFTGLNPQTTHQYRIRAVNELGAGSWSAPINMTTYLLPTPSGMTEQLSDTSITFTWTAVTGAASYEVEADGQVTSVSMATYSQTSLTPETPHTYRIRAIGTSGESGWTEPFIFTTLPSKPAVPANVTATASKNQVFLNWSAVSGALGYDVELDGVVIVDNFTDTNYSDTLLNPFSQHQYRIRARTDAIEGDWSALVSLRTLPDKPTIPSNIAVTSTANIVSLSWASDPTATKYEVEVDGQVFDAGVKPEYKHRRVVLGTEHKYRIRTTNVSGVGAWSGRIINNTLVARLSKAGTIDMGMVGKDIMDFSRYTLKVTYDPNAVEIVDLSTLTGMKELTTGRIAGTDVIVSAFRPGEVTFVTDKAISPDESWTGVINSVQMKAKVSGGSSITYSVIERPDNP